MLTRDAVGFTLEKVYTGLKSQKQAQQHNMHPRQRRAGHQRHSEQKGGRRWPFALATQAKASLFYTHSGKRRSELAKPKILGMPTR